MQSPLCQCLGLLALLVLTACAHSGGLAPAREARIQNAYGTPIAGARVIHARGAQAEAAAKFIATSNADGQAVLPSLPLPPKNQAPAQYYIIAAAGYEEFIVWPAMLAGDPAAGKGYNYDDSVLVLTLTPLPGFTPAPPAAAP